MAKEEIRMGYGIMERDEREQVDFASKVIDKIISALID